MARVWDRLTHAALKRRRIGLFADGGGLYLQVTEPKDGDDLNRSWLFRYKVDGKDRWMGGGSVHTRGLAEAREWARQQRLHRLAGIDPIAHRNAEKAAKAVAEAHVVSFESCAHDYMAAKRSGWKSPKHSAEWARSLAKYVYPVFGNLPVASVDTALILKVLNPIWETKHVTASRLRGRIESILDFATTANYRPEGQPNPARWSGHLEHMLTDPFKARDCASRREAAGSDARLDGAVARPRWTGTTGLRVLDRHGHAHLGDAGGGMARDQPRRRAVGDPRPKDEGRQGALRAVARSLCRDSARNGEPANRRHGVSRLRP